MDNWFEIRVPDYRLIKIVYQGLSAAYSDIYYMKHISIKYKDRN